MGSIQTMDHVKLLAVQLSVGASSICLVLLHVISIAFVSRSVWIHGRLTGDTTCWVLLEKLFYNSVIVDLCYIGTAIVQSPENIHHFTPFKAQRLKLVHMCLL